MRSNQETPQVPSGTAALVKGLDILNLIGSSTRPLRFNEIQKSSGFTKPTLARILRTLLAYRLIKQDDDTRYYTAGDRFLELAQHAWEIFDLRSAASGELGRLSALTEETVAVCKLDGDAVRYVDHRNSGGLSVQIMSNQRSPLHSTASGKALLAFLPYGTQRSLITALDFKSFTDKTICDIEAFRKELAVTQSRGYAVSIEEHIEGVSSVAAPINGPNGTSVGALAVMGPASRLNDDKLHAAGEDLMAAARRITGVTGL